MKHIRCKYQVFVPFGTFQLRLKNGLYQVFMRKNAIFPTDFGTSGKWFKNTKTWLLTLVWVQNSPFLRIQVAKHTFFLFVDPLWLCCKIAIISTFIREIPPPKPNENCNSAFFYFFCWTFWPKHLLMSWASGKIVLCGVI